MFQVFFEVADSKQSFKWVEPLITVDMIKRAVPTATGAIKCTDNVLLSQRDGLYHLDNGAIYIVIVQGLKSFVFN